MRIWGYVGHHLTLNPECHFENDPLAHSLFWDLDLAKSLVIHRNVPANYRKNSIGILTIGFTGGRFIVLLGEQRGAIHRTVGSDSSWITSSLHKVVHKSLWHFCYSG